MAERVRFGRWEVEVDRDKTIEAYSRIGVGSPESCGCLHCRNFASARIEAYPPQVREIFNKLGIDPAREAEIYYNGPLKNGLHLYGGWFHFVGRTFHGDDAHKQISENTGTLDLEDIEGRCQLGVTENVQLVPEEFVGLELVQLEFLAEIPWVLEQPPEE